MQKKIHQKRYQPKTFMNSNCNGQGEKMCVDPGGNVAILSVGGGGGPGLPGGEENGQLASDSGGG